MALERGAKTWRGVGGLEAKRLSRLVMSHKSYWMVEERSHLGACNQQPIRRSSKRALQQGLPSLSITSSQCELYRDAP